MASTINGTSTGSGGLISTGDDSGILNIQTNETTAITVDASQRVAFVAGTAALPAITTTGDTNTGIYFPAADTIAFSEGGAESMRIDSSGNVGIGTSSPTTKLHITGNLTIENSSNAPFINFVESGDNTDVKARIEMDQVSGTAGNLLFYTEGSGTLAERMRIDSSGNLLVGTTSAGSGATGGLFRVSKTSGNGIYSEAATTAAGYRYISNALSDGGTYYHFNFTEGGTQRGSITSNGSNTSYTTSSDYRLKENIQPLTGALSLVSRLKPSAFRWKETGTEDSGFIAHELQEVCPSAVTGEKDAVDADGNPKYQSVDTSFLVATLTAALQELKAELDELKAKVNA